MSRKAEEFQDLIRNDGWANVITALGTIKDKRTHGKLTAAVTYTEAELEAAYQDDMIARIVDLPAEDMTREWIDIHLGADTKAGKGTNAAGEEGDELSKTLLQDLEDLDAQSVFADALRWSKLHGGAIIILGIDDGQDPIEEVDIDSVRGVKYLTVLNRWQALIEARQTNPLSKGYGDPLIYRLRDEDANEAQLVTPTGEEVSQVLGRQPLVHASRCIRFPGVPTSMRRRRELNGWDDSILVRIYEVVRDFQAAWGGAAHLMTDLGQSVIKIHRLAAMLAADQNNQIAQRLAWMDIARSVVNAIPLDAEHEDWERKATPLDGVHQTLQEFGARLAAASDMPLTKLMGRSPAGMNSTGESDTRNWYDTIRSRQNNVLLPRISILMSHLMRARGIDPKNEDWSIVARPLWQPTEKERAEVRKTDAESDAIHLQWNVLSADEVAASAYSGDRYSSHRQVDPERIEEMKRLREEGEDLPEEPKQTFFETEE